MRRHLAGAGSVGHWLPRLTGLMVVAAATRIATADRYEATLTVRPVAGLGLFTEDVAMGGGDSAASTYGGGGEISMSYGVRNWLDISGEAIGAAFTQASYDPAMVTVHGQATTGRMTRTTRLGQLRAGATLRLGVAWVPVLHLGLGVSARMPTAATLRDEKRDVIDVTPDGMDAGISLDLCVIARVGLEHRMDRRWSVGVAGELAHAAGLGSPPIDLVSAGVSLSYTWYPGWW